MKNVTITLGEDVAEWARIWAARHGTSMSRLVGEMLRERMLHEEGYEAAMKLFLAGRPTALRKDASVQYPAREALHERR